MREPSYLELMAFASRVRTCPETGACCRAAAAALLREPVDRCGECGHPMLPGELCPCLRFVGEPANPAAATLHAASKGM